MGGQEDGATFGGRLPQQAVKLVLHERIQPGGGLIEHQQLGAVHEREHDPELLAVALRQLVDLAVEDHPEPFDQLIAQPLIDPAAGAGEPVEHAPAGHPRVKLELAGQVAAAGVDGDAVAEAVQPEHPGAAGAGALQAEQQPDRGRLARAVGPEEPEHLPAVDAQIEPVDRDRRPERFRQPLCLDGGGHGWAARCARVHGDRGAPFLIKHRRVAVVCVMLGAAPRECPTG